MPDNIKITLSNPLSAEQCQRLGIGDVEQPVGSQISVTSDIARSIIDAGYATLDPEDPVAVAEALGDPVPEPVSTDSAAQGPFDPTGHSVAEVNTYLGTADDAEKTRVLDAERAGKNRSSIDGI